MTRRTAVLATVVVGLATVLVAGGTWVRAVAPGVLPVEVSVSGTAAAPAVAAAGLVTVAAGLALSLGGRGVRWAVVIALALAGTLVAWSAADVLADPEPAARSAALAQVGTAVAESVTTTWLAPLGGGLGLVVLVLAALVARGRWSAVPARHGGPDRGNDPLDPFDTWDALSRGDDPSAP